MSHEQSPAFQFYPRDFLADARVASMSPAACGVYIRLLCHCWIEGSVENDSEMIRRLVGFSGRNWSAVWCQARTCFVIHDGRLVQPRIERERAKQAEFRAKKAQAGSAGGKQKASKTLADPLAKPTSSSSSSSSVKIPSSNNKLVTDAGVSSTSVVVASRRDVTPPQRDEVRGVEKPKRVGGANGAMNARSNHPIYRGRRFVVFDWMLEDIGQILGPSVTDFGLDEFFDKLDKAAAAENVVLPRAEVWPWLQTRIVAEAQQRGMPIVTTLTKQAKKAQAHADRDAEIQAWAEATDRKRAVS